MENSILDVVSSVTGVSQESIRGNSHKDNVATARHITFYMEKTLGKKSYTNIAKEFGRTPSTVRGGVLSIENRLSSHESGVDKMVSAIGELLGDYNFERMKKKTIGDLALENSLLRVDSSIAEKMGKTQSAIIEMYLGEFCKKNSITGEKLKERLVIAHDVAGQSIAIVNKDNSEDVKFGIKYHLGDFNNEVKLWYEIFGEFISQKEEWPLTAECLKNLNI